MKFIITESQLKEIANNYKSKMLLNEGVLTSLLEMLGITSAEVIDKLESAGVKYSESIGRAFKELAEKESLTFNESKLVSGVLRRLYPGYVERFIGNLRNQFLDSRVVPIYEQLFENPKATNEYISRTMKKAGLDVSPEAVQLWRDYKTNAPNPIVATKSIYSASEKSQPITKSNVVNKPVTQTATHVAISTVEKKYTFTRNSLMDISDGSGLQPKGKEIINPNKINNMFSVGDKIEFYAERKRTGTWDGKMIREDGTNLPWGMAGILNQADGYVKNITKIEEESSAAGKSSVADKQAPTIKVKPYETGDVVITGTKPGSGGGTVCGNYELPDFRRVLSNVKGYNTGIHFGEFIWGDKKVFSLIDGSVLDGDLHDPMGRNGYIATSIVLDKNTTTTLSEVKADLEELHAQARTGLNKNNKIDVEKVKQAMNGYRWVSHEVKPVEPTTTFSVPKPQAAAAQRVGGFNGLVGDEIRYISTDAGEHAWTLDFKNGQYVVDHTTYPNVAEIIKRPESLIKPMFNEQNIARPGENKITITKPAVFQKGDNGNFKLIEKGKLWYGEGENF